MDLTELEDAIRDLARARRWADVERLGKLALDLATDERDRDALVQRDSTDHVALAERDVRDVATSELDTPDVTVLPSRDPLVETIALGARDAFVGLVAGSGDARAHHARAAAIGYRRVRQRDHLALIFLTREDQGLALLEAITRAWPHL